MLGIVGTLKMEAETVLGWGDQLLPICPDLSVLTLKSLETPLPSWANQMIGGPGPCTHRHDRLTRKARLTQGALKWLPTLALLSNLVLSVISA